MTVMRCLGMIFVIAAGVACAPLNQPVDVVLHNGKIFTGVKDQKWVSAIAIDDGQIVYVGDDDGASEYTARRKTVNLDGALVLPGLVDSHTHPGMISRTTDAIDLPLYGSKEDVLSVVSEYAAAHPEKEFIVGGYWQTRLFDENGPHKSELDAVVSDRPVILVDSSGHSQWMNSKALEVMGIDRDTPDPVPGLSYFYRDENGDPTGWAKEFAARWQMRELGMRGQPDPLILKEFLDYLLSMGVTTLLDAGNSGAGAEIYEIVAELDRKGELPLRYEGVYHIILPDQIPGAITAVKDLQSSFGGERLNINTIKFHFDGVHEVATSGVIDPFINTDDDNRGGLIMTQAELRSFILAANQENIDLHLHTVGDRATRTVLDSVEAARQDVQGSLDIQVTLCHLELIADEDFKRFRELDVAANYTPHWHGGWIDGAQYTLGQERFDNLYRAQPLIDDGALVTFSSDIVSVFEWKTKRGNPYFGMQIGHTRIEPELGESANPRPPTSEQLRLEDLVLGYTLNGAKQLGLGEITGSIEVGKSADLVVLDQNLFTADPGKIELTKPVAVMLEGEVVHGALP